MTWRLGPAQSRGPRNNSSPAARRADRSRAEAEGMSMLEREAKLRRDKTAKLKKLREARDAEDAAKAE